jgi:5-carboxymethyl-2-hydroxymuconate isomerase
MKKVKQCFHPVARACWHFLPRITRWQMTAALAVQPGGNGDYAFVYLQLRMANGRTSATHASVGDALLKTTQAHFADIFDKRHIGITLQVDEGAPAYDAKHSNLHPLFNKV